jgi:hypothetical protein
VSSSPPPKSLPQLNLCLMVLLLRGNKLSMRRGREGALHRPGPRMPHAKTGCARSSVNIIMNWNDIVFHGWCTETRTRLVKYCTRCKNHSWTGPEGSTRLRLPDLKKWQTKVVGLSALRNGRLNPLRWRALVNAVMNLRVP